MRVLKKLSVVVPCHNDEAVLDEFYRRLSLSLEKVSAQWEILFVNDGSRDGTWEIIERLHASDVRVKGVNLSRNFGQQAALTAGLDAAFGDAILTLDSDLQDPPECVPEFIRKWQEGYEIVHGVRAGRAGDSLVRSWCAGLFYRVLRRVSGSPLPLHAGDFRLLDRRVVDALRQSRERHRYVKALSAWMGFRQTSVPCEREPSARTSSGYGLFRLLALSLDAVAAFSVLPLRIALFLGLLIFAASAAGGLAVIFLGLYRGWTPLIVALGFFCGIQLLFLGVLGEYIGRIYEETKQRPIYVVERSIGVDQKGLL